MWFLTYVLTGVSMNFCNSVTISIELHLNSHNILILFLYLIDFMKVSDNSFSLKYFRSLVDHNLIIFAVCSFCGILSSYLRVLCLSCTYKGWLAVLYFHIYVYHS